MTDAAGSVTLLHRVSAIVTRPITIIAAFLVPKVPIALSALNASPPRYDISGAIAAEIIILLGLAYPVVRGNRFASWAMSIAVWLQGLFSCVVAFAPRTIPWGLRVLSVCLGVYYIAGGFILVKRNGRRAPNQAL